MIDEIYGFSGLIRGILSFSAGLSGSFSYDVDANGRKGTVRYPLRF
jgi:hypothetical protein